MDFVSSPIYAFLVAAQLCLRATTLYFGSQVKHGFELLYLKGGLEMIDSLWQN